VSDTCGSGLGDAASAVVAARVPAGQRVDLDARSRVRRVDEATAADVHPDMPEPVEEDEVAGVKSQDVVWLAGCLGCGELSSGLLVVVFVEIGEDRFQRVG